MFKECLVLALGTIFLAVPTKAAEPRVALPLAEACARATASRPR